MPPIDELTEKRTKNEATQPPFVKLLLKTVTAYVEADRLRAETIDDVIDHISGFWANDEPSFDDLAEHLDPAFGGKLKAIFGLMFPADVPIEEALRPLMTIVIDNAIREALRGQEPEEPTAGDA